MADYTEIKRRIDAITAFRTAYQQNPQAYFIKGASAIDIQRNGSSEAVGKIIATEMDWFIQNHIVAICDTVLTRLEGNYRTDLLAKKQELLDLLALIEQLEQQS